MNKCLWCGKQTSNEYYCSRRCGAIHKGKKQIKWAKCKGCGKRFRPKSKTKGIRTVYHSPKCYGQTITKDKNVRSNGKWLKCSYCKNELYRTAKQIELNKTGRFYCDKKCQKEGVRGKHHHLTGIKLTGRRYAKAVKTLKPFFFKEGDSNNPSWKGGISPFHERIRKTSKYRRWREAVFKKDNWTCQICGKRGGKLHADHIKAFSKIIKENQVETLKQAYACKELWDVNNGRTLDEECHEKTDNYGSKVNKRGGE